MPEADVDEMRVDGLDRLAHRPVDATIELGALIEPAG